MAGTSPSNAGGMGSILGQRAKIPCASRDQNIEQKQCWNKFNKDLKNKTTSMRDSCLPHRSKWKLKTDRWANHCPPPPHARTLSLSLTYIHTHTHTHTHTQARLEQTSGAGKHLKSSRGVIQRPREACQASSDLCSKSLQSCPTLCNPMDRNPPGSSVHGILHAKMLE